MYEVPYIAINTLKPENRLLDSMLIPKKNKKESQ